MKGGSYLARRIIAGAITGCPHGAADRYLDVPSRFSLHHPTIENNFDLWEP